jgi:hypothetical protein
LEPLVAEGAEAEAAQEGESAPISFQCAACGADYQIEDQLEATGS